MRPGSLPEPFSLRRGRAILAACAAALVLGGCAGGPHRDSRVWDVRAGAWITEALLLERLARADAILLGELHDSPEHHGIQRRLVAGLLERGRRPVLAMEQFDLEHQDAIDAARAGFRPEPLPGGRAFAAEPPADSPLARAAEAVASAGRLDRGGWDWPFYRPLVTLALAAGSPIRAANLSREEARRVMRGGFAALGEARATALGLPPSFAEAETRAMTAEIVRDHCDAIDARQAAPMALAQQARDAVMASVVAAHAANGVVLIAGNGHVRRDVGVPRYLPPALRERTVALALVERDGGTGAPDPALARRYDYVWAARPTERGDPCAVFKLPARATPR